MNSAIPKSFRYSLLLMFGALFFSGCSSSSDSNLSEPQTTVQMSGTNGDGVASAEGTDGAASAMEDTTTDDATDSASNPQGLSTTRVDFNITVPVYSSNALQVRLVWGDIDTTAIWNRDEQWTASVDLPTNTENQLIITFSDDNGAITLGRVERSFTTGSDQSESLQIAADEFDTDRWDTDGDGVSNLNELTSGTPAQVDPEMFQASLDVMPTKTFRLSWEQSVGATYYQILENQTGSSGFVSVSENLPADALSYDHRVALFNSLNARYVVEACNASGCTSSNELFIAGTLEGGVGVINASGPEETVSEIVTISADGQTLAFAAFRPAPTEVENTRPFASAVYIYTLNEGVWQQQARVEPNSIDIGDNFGRPISLNGDGTVLAVSAENDDSADPGINGDESDNSLFDSGAVYVFALIDGSWQQEAYIKASEPERNGRFGRAIDLSADGETLAVNTENSDFDRISIFTRTNSGWQLQATVGTDRSLLQNRFVSLSENGDTLATGGIPHVFSRTNGVWQRTAILEREDVGALGILFGSSGTLSDDGMTLVISSPYDSSRATGVNPPDEDRFVNATLDRAGAVHVYSLVNGSWVQQAYIKPSVAENFTFFGEGVSISADGNTLAVTSRDNTVGTGIFDDYTTIDSSILVGSQNRTGSVYIYRRSAGAWTHEAYVKPAQNLFRFIGAPVLDASGDTMVIQGTNDDGVVYIY